MGYFSTLTIRGSGLRKFKESLQEQIPNSELNKFLENLGKNAKMPRTQGFQVVGAGNAKNCEVKMVENENKENIELEYSDGLFIVGSVSQTSITPTKHRVVLEYEHLVTLSPSPRDVRRITSYLSKLKAFSDECFFRVKDHEVFVVVESKIPVTQTRLSFSSMFVYSESTEEFEVCFSITYLLSVLKLLSNNITIGLAEAAPMLLKDSENTFAVAPIVM